MKILIAEDDHTTRLALKATLDKWGYDVLVASDGAEAWQILRYEDAPKLVILDWVMPRMDGLEVCQRIRESPGSESTYIILLTVREHNEDIVTGLRAGADDYVTKPFNREELHARVQAGIRVVELQKKLAHRVRELESALSQINRLHGLLPICCYCKKIRNDHNYWQQVEEYISEHSDVRFSHSICPKCYKEIVEPKLDELKDEEETVTQSSFDRNP